MDAPVLILGNDGYTGWALTCHLLGEGYDVVGVDTHFRREEAEHSITPIADPHERYEAAGAVYDGFYENGTVDITDRDALMRTIELTEPQAIVNLAQIPAAPFSMRSSQAAWFTQENNIKGALNLVWALREYDEEVPVVQLATMGEYGTPDEPIPEGFLEDGRPAPKSPGSFYHASKVNATVNTYFAAETWGLPVTEIYQGIVYGLPHVADERLLTRFDADATWGTVLNRFTAQAVAERPLTVYGQGGQKRAMLPIDDCVRCIQLAIENPPSEDGPGEYPYRAINQFQESHRVRELAEMVQSFTGADIAHIENPREEDDSDHFYDPEREVLDELGYEPSATVEDVFRRTYNVVEDHRDRIVTDELLPETYWTGKTPHRTLADD